MFENFSDKITKIFDSLAGKKIITEDDINSTMREVRIALLEADVSLEVAKNFIEEVKQEAIGQQVFKNVSAGQMIIKILHDHLVKLLGLEKSEINFNTKPPAIILMVGLQGAGKTTTTGKLAKYLKNKIHKKTLIASLDIYRPAAASQLEILAKKIEVDYVQFDQNKSVLQLAVNAKEKAIEGGYEALILDSAGRIHLDLEMMKELIEVNQKISPSEILLVVDALTGQDAINIAKGFKESLPLSGVIMTRMDGSARAGATLTMKAITNCPIKFIGTGEKLEDLEEFNPERIASRIVGMGDVVSLVEKAKEVFDEEELRKTEKKLRSGQLDLEDLLSQIRNMKKMGGLNSIMKFLPGMGAIKESLGKLGNFEKEIKIQEAIILSMTKKERKNPLVILNSSRKNRIAKGAGTTIQEVNRLLKKYKQMQKMVGKFGKIDPTKIQEMMSDKNLNF
jgi:signal recognition particle subunit SRP54